MAMQYLVKVYNDNIGWPEGLYREERNARSRAETLREQGHNAIVKPIRTTQATID